MLKRNPVSKKDAQARTDQIKAFQTELQILEGEEVLSLSEGQQAALTSYHKGLIKEYITTYDIDTSSHEKQLSLGMKITSFLGALALAASIFLLFNQYWGKFSTMMQLIILTATPLLALWATIYTLKREKTGYFSKIFAMVGLAAFILNLVMLGDIFNITPSENAFLIWAAFAFLLAYATDARLLLGAGIISLAFFLSAKTGTWAGCYWIGFGERPENFFPAAMTLFALSLLPHDRYSGFQPIYRTFAMLLILMPVLVLSNWGVISYMNFSIDFIEGFYQVTGFTISAVAIYAGIKKGWGDLVTTGNIFFTIFLYTKFFDWFWEWMPKYLFFLLLGLTAILMLMIFKRLRKSVVECSKEVSK